MHILQFMASEQWGGAEKTCVELANELSENHQVSALLLRNTLYKNRYQNKVAIFETKSHPTRNNPFLMRELFHIISNLQPDIIHTHGAKAALLIHRLSYITKINHLATKHNARKGRIFNKLPYVSVVSKQAHKSVSPKPDRLIRVIHNGISPMEVDPDPRNDIFEIAAIGRLDRVKGFDLLLKALRKLTFPYHLTIAGEGPEKKRLQQLIVDLDLGEKVSMVGFCENVPELMGRSHAVVISSHSEGFPQVMVEALFYGNVLLSTAVGGIVEVLPEMFLTNHEHYAKKLEHVYKNYDDYHERFNQLRVSRSVDFELSTIVEQYEELYQEIMLRSGTNC